MNDWANLADAARLGGAVIYPLTLLAIAALAITLDRAYAFWRFARLPSGRTRNVGSRRSKITRALTCEHAFLKVCRPATRCVGSADCSTMSARRSGGSRRGLKQPPRKSNAT